MLQQQLQMLLQVVQEDLGVPRELYLETKGTNQPKVSPIPSIGTMDMLDQN